MTVRLRVMSGGTTSEYAFDRTKISVGRSPANDLAISSGSVALKHGVLEFGEDGVLRFLVDACGQPSMLVRDGEVARELEASGRASLELRESDFLILGGVTRIEVLEARTREATRYTEYRLDAHLSYDLPVAVSGRYLRALDHLSAASNRVRTLLVEACGLVESLIGASVNRAVVSLFTEHDEFHDDTWALEFGQAEADSELFDMARDPLAHFGPAAKKDALELFVQGNYLIAQSERGVPASAFLVGIVQNERCIGVLVIERAEAFEAGPELAFLGRALATLATLAMSARVAEQRARSLGEENRYFRERERRHYLFKELICESPSMKAVYKALNAMVSMDGPVLILGEAGTGKELLARALHHLGPRREGMFISTHCGRLSDEVLGVELFGCVASELAGAVAARKGIFELAQDGTVYLEEIDMLSPMMQGKLVRMLKEGEVRRVGDSVGRRVNARLIASTHRDVQESVRTGRLRPDLYILLKESLLRVPSLRERREDLLPLARTFLKIYARRYNKSACAFDEGIAETLSAHDWPGNVRELQSLVEAAVLKCAPDSQTLESSLIKI